MERQIRVIVLFVFVVLLFNAALSQAIAHAQARATATTWGRGAGHGGAGCGKGTGRPRNELRNDRPGQARAIVRRDRTQPGGKLIAVRSGRADRLRLRAATTVQVLAERTVEAWAALEAVATAEIAWAHAQRLYPVIPDCARKRKHP